MKVFRINWVVCTLASLLICMYSSVCVALTPLSTRDWSRLRDSAKQGAEIAKQAQTEIKSNLNIIKQIQNGGYAAAAGELFGKVENGDYDRYGKMFADSKQVLKDGADATKKKKEEDAKIQEKNQETAAKAAEEIAKDNKEAQKQADAVQKVNNEKAKKSKWSQAYNWVKKYGRSTADTAFGTADAIENGGSLKTIGKNIFDVANKSGKEVYEGMKEEHDQKKAEKQKQAEELAKNLKEVGEKTAKDLNKQLEEQHQKEEKAKSDALLQQLQQQNKK